MDKLFFSEEHIMLVNMVADFARSEIEPIASCLLYTSPSPRDKRQSRMPSSA